MKLQLPEKADRGQVGIGTLIIFIALVLVAAVAAGVLVTTADQLQTRASDTGTDAQAQVSNQIDVVSATGAVNSNEVDTVTLVVKKSPGSESIDLSEATVQYTSDSDSQTFTNLTVQNTDGTSASDTVLDDTSDRKQIVVTPPTALSEGASASLDIVDQSGATTTYGVNVPDVLTGSYVKV
ncbi:flagellin-like protein [Halarchaeum solikamskense]|uniref:archaellin/type IV pilin N-terminal domain-containing protein n=1 Tax=Halarchaeum nitratireducens TaxID=489913 RepID=UPI001B3B1660|nr:archaellin/type IV pilin N-terminal domain-containing protein [Halarchaeum solikamskense]MBP2252414.1 flagellin-like protein [Halarchaeum solikamskense]